MQVAALENGFLGPGNAELGSYVRHIPVRAVEEWDRGGRKAAETNTVMAGHQMQDGGRRHAAQKRSSHSTLGTAKRSKSQSLVVSRDGHDSKFRTDFFCSLPCDGQSCSVTIQAIAWNM